MNKYYKDCEYCEGEGGHYEYCCSGVEDGVQTCGCCGRGTWNECVHCEEGKVEHDTIIWDFATLEEQDRHDHEIVYFIIGKGEKHGEGYIAAAVYIHGELSEIVDIELQPYNQPSPDERVYGC